MLPLRDQEVGWFVTGWDGRALVPGAHRGEVEAAVCVAAPAPLCRALQPRDSRAAWLFCSRQFAGRVWQ